MIPILKISQSSVLKLFFLYDLLEEYELFDLLEEYELEEYELFDELLDE